MRIPSSLSINTAIQFLKYFSNYFFDYRHYLFNGRCKREKCKTREISKKKKIWYLSTNDNKQINNSMKTQDMMKLFFIFLFLFLIQKCLDSEIKD